MSNVARKVLGKVFLWTVYLYIVYLIVCTALMFMGLYHDLKWFFWAWPPPYTGGYP